MGTTPIIDVVILSNAKTSALWSLTQNTIDSCIAGAAGYSVRIIVIEQKRGKAYIGAETVFKYGNFNFNAFANYGVSLGSAEWAMVANNDLIFQDGWLHELMKVGHPVMSCKCPVDARQADVLQNTSGYENGRLFSGWCFVIMRDLWKALGGFDEDVFFWCSDDAFLEQLKKCRNCTHACGE